MSWISKIFGGGSKSPPKRGAALTAALASYPASAPPHLGNPRKLTEAKAKANLDYLLATKDARMASILNLLSGFGIDAKGLLDPAVDPLPICDAIDAWLVKELPERENLPGQPSANPPHQMFLDCNRDGPLKIFSMAADLGILVFEAIRVRDHNFEWAVDLDSPKLGLVHYKRPCLIRPKVGKDWGGTIFDAEKRMLGVVYEKRITIPIYRVGDDLEGLLRGAFNPPPP
jgi:hypothetical protein